MTQSPHMIDAKAEAHEMAGALDVVARDPTKPVRVRSKAQYQAGIIRRLLGELEAAELLAQARYASVGGAREKGESDE